MPKFIGEIVPNGGDFALIDSKYIRGGFMQVSSIKERDNILPDKLLVGMHCYVNEDNEIYVWKGSKWEIYVANTSNESYNKIEILTAHQKLIDIIEPSSNEDYESPYWGFKFNNTLFKVGDIIGWDIDLDKDENIIGNYTEIVDVHDNVVYVKKPDILPDLFKEVYLMGSVSNIVRRCILIVHPYNGTLVMSQFTNTSLSDLNIHYTFRLSQESNNKWKVYGEDVYFKGTFIDKKGNDISKLASISEESVNKNFVGIRREFGYDNLLNNPYFINGLDCWFTKSTAEYFKLSGKFIITNKTLLSTNKKGAYIINEKEQNILKIVNGYITQKNERLQKINNLDNIEPPYYVTLIFNYKPLTDGTLKVLVKYKSNNVETESVKAQQDITQDTQYITWKSTFLWDGLGDITIKYNGEILIQTLVLKMNDIKNFENKYKRLFELSDVIVEMAEKYINNS